MYFYFFATKESHIGKGLFNIQIYSWVAILVFFVECLLHVESMYWYLFLSISHNCDFLS